MNSLISFFERKVPLTNWQLWIYKVAVFCLSIAIGCYFADYLKPYLLAFVVIGVITSVWITVIWLKAMKEAYSKIT